MEKDVRYIYKYTEKEVCRIDIVMICTYTGKPKLWSLPFSGRMKIYSQKMPYLVLKAKLHFGFCSHHFMFLKTKVYPYAHHGNTHILELK